MTVVLNSIAANGLGGTKAAIAQGIVVGGSGTAAAISNGIAAGGGAAADADVTQFAADVAAGGGALPAAHQKALNDNMPALKATGAWGCIKEFHLPLGLSGDLVTASFKLKTGTASKRMTFNNLVAGDYTVSGGIDFGAVATNKTVTTDFAPAVNGALSAAEWGVSAYIMRDLTGSMLTVGMSNNTDFYLHWGGNGAGAGNSMSASPLTLQPIGGEQWQSHRLVTAQSSGGTQYAYYGGWVKNSAAISSPALPAGSFVIGGGNGAFFANCATGGYAVHAAMTPAQLRALQTFIDNVCIAIGRTVFSEELVAIGDSYVAPTPTAPSDAAHDYIALTATNYGWPYRLIGVSGRGWATCNGGQTKFTDAGGTGQVGRDAIFSGMLNAPAKRVLLCMGLNDAAYGTAVGLGTPTGTDGLLKTEMTAILDMLVAQGYPAQFLGIGTGYWASYVNLSGPGQPVSSAIATVQKALATTYGLRVCDFYNGSTFGRTDVEVADHLHKGDTGHVLLANDLIAAATGW